MATCGRDACETLKAILIVLVVTMLVLISYVLLPEVYEKLNLTIVLSMLATGIATSLAAIAILASQRNIVIHDDQKGHKAVIDAVAGGKIILTRRMNAVSLFATSMPLVVLIDMVVVLDGRAIFGASSLAAVTMIFLVWFILLLAATFRLELAITGALSKNIEK